MEPHPAEYKKLSPRQLEALQLVAQGLSRLAVARKMGLSPNTLRRYLQEVFWRLDAHNAAEAVAKASAMGILKECV